MCNVESLRIEKEVVCLFEIVFTPCHPSEALNSFEYPEIYRILPKRDFLY